METFDEALSKHRLSIERFVYFKIPSRFDADDVLQEVYIAAHRNYHTILDASAVKPWLLSIARNKCSDYFRHKAKQMELSLEEVTEKKVISTHGGIVEISTVRETLESLKDTDQQILYLTYFKNLPQAEIAQRLNIPIGTVKSRLHHAKARFKEEYPYPPKQKGVLAMKQLPNTIPEYHIAPTDKAPFSVKWEELPGKFIVPKLGESCVWGMYDQPTGQRSDVYELRVDGPAEVHGIQGVEIEISHYPQGEKKSQRTVVAQLTQSHCRYLASTHYDGNVKRYVTFLDEDFLLRWGIGPDNCGNSTDPVPEGKIRRIGKDLNIDGTGYLSDVVGRYTVTIGGKKYDTINITIFDDTNDSGVLVEQYIDQNGRTVLWRRFNRADWQWERNDGKPWTEVLPDSERITVGGMTYVHWYDCITDYIL